MLFHPISTNRYTKVLYSIYIKHFFEKKIAYLTLKNKLIMIKSLTLDSKYKTESMFKK